jgi:hypothetical protein
MNPPPDIDAVELISVRPLGDGNRLRLRVRSRDGSMQSLAIPAKWLNAMVEAAPHPLLDGAALPVASWSMQATYEGDLLLTLRTPEEQAFSFTVKPWQAQGIGTLAAYGHLDSKKTAVH